MHSRKGRLLIFILIYILIVNFMKLFLLFVSYIIYRVLVIESIYKVRHKYLFLLWLWLKDVTISIWLISKWLPFRSVPYIFMNLYIVLLIWYIRCVIFLFRKLGIGNRISGLPEVFLLLLILKKNGINLLIQDFVFRVWLLYKRIIKTVLLCFN